MRSPSTRYILDTLARLHLAADAMQIPATEIMLEAMDEKTQAACHWRAAEDFRAWVNGEEPKEYPPGKSAAI